MAKNGNNSTPFLLWLPSESLTSRQLIVLNQFVTIIKAKSIVFYCQSIRLIATNKTALNLMLNNVTFP